MNTFKSTMSLNFMKGLYDKTLSQTVSKEFVAKFLDSEAPFAKIYVKEHYSEAIIKADRTLRLMHNAQGSVENNVSNGRGNIIVYLFPDDINNFVLIEFISTAVKRIEVHVFDKQFDTVINVELPTGCGYTFKFSENLISPEENFNLIGELFDFVEDYS